MTSVGCRFYTRVNKQHFACWYINRHSLLLESVVVGDSWSYSCATRNCADGFGNRGSIMLRGSERARVIDKGVVRCSERPVALFPSLSVFIQMTGNENSAMGARALNFNFPGCVRGRAGVILHLCVRWVQTQQRLLWGFHNIKLSIGHYTTNSAQCWTCAHCLGRSQ